MGDILTDEKTLRRHDGRSVIRQSQSKTADGVGVCLHHCLLCHKVTNASQARSMEKQQNPCCIMQLKRNTYDISQYERVLL